MNNVTNGLILMASYSGPKILPPLCGATTVNDPLLDEAAGERDEAALVLLAPGGIVTEMTTRMTGGGIVMIGTKEETAEGGIGMMTGRRGGGDAAGVRRGEGGAGAGAGAAAEERIGKSRIWLMKQDLPKGTEMATCS